MPYPIFYPQARVNFAIVPFSSVGITTLESLIRLGAAPPRRVRVTHNDIFTADMFDLELDETLFPLDPRDVRAVVVDVHLADAGRLGGVIDTTSDTNRLLLGQTDKIVKNLRTNSASTVGLSGRDYTGLWLDEKWQGRSVELGRPLSEIVEEVKDSIPAVARMVVESVDGLDPIVPAGVGKKRKRYTAKPDTSVWKALLELALRVGVILTVDRDRVQIQPPRNVLNEAARARTPLFVEGRNLEELSIERILGTQDVPNVLVQAIDPGTGAIVEGRYPTNWKETARATKARERAKKTTNVEFRRFVVRHPAPTEAALTQIAERVYGFHAREQVAISFSTKDLVVSPAPLPAEIERTLRLEDETEVSPTTQIRNGSPVRIRVEPDVRNVLERAISPEDKARELRQNGYADQVAVIMATGFRELDELLFVKTATHEYDGSSDRGYSLSVDAVNFVEVGI